MPVNVKDLVITTNISGSSSNTKNTQQSAPSTPMSKADIEVIIKETLRRVMEELAYKKGR